MKKIFLILLFTLLPFTIFAGPFGLKMGMTLEEVTEACDKKPQFYKDDCYFIYPEKKHPLFVTYIAFIDKEKGLYCIKAKSDDISSLSIKDNTYEELIDLFTKKYGESEELELTKTWRDDFYLYTGNYVIGQKWEKNLPDNLSSVYLIESSSLSRWFFILEYDFTNKSSIEEAQDDVL